ncbi:MAG: asparagine synthase (glutamine-hydrolyzing) [Bacteroidetes bacterium]|nr:asparagine synthase (glutamine-hydrolyzing) [Bacteroidota bacterium]
MCGITGIYHFNKERSVDKSQLKRMTDIIRHRGPDSDGFYLNGNIGLGHRRLSIIDLSTGDQPMFNNDKSISIIFNGEIYNYIELRQELIQKGHKFRTTSDTEVAIKSYEEWGFDCQNKFNGMWAFALWDERKKHLFLSRDRIGEKPLHYTIYNNSLIFGSEIKSLFAYGIPKRFETELIEIYLVLTYIPAPYTFYKDIKKLLPGHYLLIKNENVEEKKYWDLPEIDEDNMFTNKGKIYDKFDYLLKDSVKIRMRSDVPFGAFLSGGLDSSSIVALMSEISNFPVKTFTIGFDDTNFDESALAQEVAKKFNTEHFRGTVTPDKFEESLERIVFHYDEPFGDSSAIPTGYVSKFAADKVKMVLTGDGGDEVLSGYRGYIGLKFIEKYKRIPYVIRKNLPFGVHAFSYLFKGTQKYKLNRVVNILETANLPFQERLIQKRTYTPLNSIVTLTKGIKNVIPIREYVNDILGKIKYKDEFYKYMYLNFKYDLPNDYLVKVDRMSMAYSLEARIPFLDYRLIELMINVSKDVKLQGWETKSVLRNTVGKKLPKSILHSPKRGFGIPVREWFKDKSMAMHLNDILKLENLLDKKTLIKIINENREGKRDNGNFIWGLLVLYGILNK